MQTKFNLVYLHLLLVNNILLFVGKEIGKNFLSSNGAENAINLQNSNFLTSDV